MDLNAPIDINKIAEELIKKSQKDFGYIKPSDLGDGNNNVFAGLAKQKMIGFGLIAKDDTKEMYYLTDRGWLFENFDKEKRFYNRERFVKNNAYWRAKYWLVLVIAGYIFGLLTPTLTEMLKSIFLRLSKR